MSFADSFYLLLTGRVKRGPYRVRASCSVHQSLETFRSRPFVPLSGTDVAGEGGPSNFNTSPSKRPVGRHVTSDPSPKMGRTPLPPELNATLSLRVVWATFTVRVTTYRVFAVTRVLAGSIASNIRFMRPSSTIRRLTRKQSLVVHDLVVLIRLASGKAVGPFTASIPDIGGYVSTIDIYFRISAIAQVHQPRAPIDRIDHEKVLAERRDHGRPYDIDGLTNRCRVRD